MSHFDETSGVVACMTQWGRWWQTMEEVYVEVPVPHGTTGKEVKCTITPKTLTVLVKGSVVIQVTVGLLYNNKMLLRKC